MNGLRFREGRLACGRTTWLPLDELINAAMEAKHCQAWWNAAGRRWVSTVKIGRWWLRRLWDSPEIVGQTIEALLTAGHKPNVSGWGAVWRQISGGFIPPCGNASVRELLASGDWPYPYCESRPGINEGGWAEWDIKSAYPWASSRGLPAPWTLASVPYDGVVSDDTAYLLRSWQQVSLDPEIRNAPPWARSYRESRWYLDANGNVREREQQRVMFQEDPPASLHWVPGEAANILGLAWKEREQVAAVKWSREIDLRPAFDRVRSTLPPLPAKMALAAHWGSWSKGSGCNAGILERGEIKKSWSLPASSNPLFAGLLQSRVSCRVADYADGSPRVYVDSVLLPAKHRPSPSGSNPGDWRKKTIYRNGCIVPEHPRRPRPFTNDPHP